MIGTNAPPFKAAVDGDPAQPVDFGDSGSPVTVDADSGLLAGMLIATFPPKDGHLNEAYVIPAWRLLDATLYTNGAAKGSWSLIDPADPLK
jgi:hypothetical protein